MKHFIIIFAAAIGLMTSHAFAKDERELFNVSYDPTRELYEDYKNLFIKHWKDTTGEEVKVQQSNGGSGKQARSVIDGLNADVVTLALAYDIDMIVEKANLLPKDWQQKLPHNSTPYVSTIVFLVKKGNPKKILDWNDLIRPGVEVVTPNPKTSGGARWNYMAAWAYAMDHNNQDEAAAKDFVSKLFKNVPVLDTGARGATTTFVQRGIGDVLLAWENEAFLAVKEFGADAFDIVVPSMSILAEPPVAVLDKNAEKKGNLDLAKAYLEYLYAPESQKLIAEHFYRPTDPEIAAEFASKFPQLKMVSIADFGGWAEVQKKHFNDGGIFDQIYAR